MITSFLAAGDYCGCAGKIGRLGRVRCHDGRGSALLEPMDRGVRT
jgi:hypothetical protein